MTAAKRRPHLAPVRQAPGAGGFVIDRHPADGPPVPVPAGWELTAVDGAGLFLGVTLRVPGPAYSIVELPDGRELWVATAGISPAVRPGAAA